MTMNEIRETDKAMLTPADIADVLGSDPQTIRLMARQRPELVKFPYTFIGTRMKIPTAGFIRWYEGMN